MKPQMNFVEAVKTCLSKYATFNGRARRSEFWWFYLLTCIPGFLMSLLVQWKFAKIAEIQAMAYQDFGPISRSSCAGRKLRHHFHGWFCDIGPHQPCSLHPFAGCLGSSLARCGQERSHAVAHPRLRYRWFDSIVYVYRRQQARS